MLPFKTAINNFTKLFLIHYKIFFFLKKEGKKIIQHSSLDWRLMWSLIIYISFHTILLISSNLLLLKTNLKF